jgi:hypothetical protein
VLDFRAIHGDSDTVVMNKGDVENAVLASRWLRIDICGCPQFVNPVSTIRN